MTAALATPSADPTRSKEIAKIKIGAKALALTDDSYRDLLERLTGHRSAAELNFGQRMAVIDHLKGLGAYRRRSARRAGERPLAEGAQASKIRALWLALHHLGEVIEPSEQALMRFVERSAGIAALQWLDPKAADTVIRALKGWCERVGFRQPTPAEARRLDAARAIAGMAPGGMPLAAKVALIDAQWRALIAAGAMRTGSFARLDTWLFRRGFGVSHPQWLSPSQADRAIELLGQWVRREGVRKAKSDKKDGADAAV